MARRCRYRAFPIAPKGGGGGGGGRFICASTVFPFG